MTLSNLNYILKKIVEDYNNYYHENLLKLVKSTEKGANYCRFNIHFRDCSGIVINDCVDLVSLLDNGHYPLNSVNSASYFNIDLTLYHHYWHIGSATDNMTYILHIPYYDNDVYQDCLKDNWSIHLFGSPGDFNTNTNVLNTLRIEKQEDKVIMKINESDTMGETPEIFEYPLDFQTSLKVET